ncbi:Serine protease snake [Eumeta japonica]|uniref:Serine protease snake n=1 Tax=Eumeta variegata TaxID=151549 RepID=A0A4C1U141_EUMVA|nr:Serine protease snake [Eumeta japonica]
MLVYFGRRKALEWLSRAGGYRVGRLSATWTDAGQGCRPQLVKLGGLGSHAVDFSGRGPCPAVGNGFLHTSYRVISLAILISNDDAVLDGASCSTVSRTSENRYGLDAPAYMLRSDLSPIKWSKDFFQSIDPFLQTYQTTKSPVRPSFESAYYVPLTFNKRTSPNHRSEAKKNEENRSGDAARKASRTERTTQRSTERLTRYPLKSTVENNTSYSLNSPSNNRNIQFFNEPKTDSNKRQNENSPRSKSNGNVHESNRHQTAKQRQTNRQGSRRNNSKPVAPQNTNAWENIEADLSDHRKDKRVSSYENNSNNKNSFNRFQIANNFPVSANEIKNTFDSSDQTENVNYYGSENVSYNTYNEPSNKGNEQMNTVLIYVDANKSTKNRLGNINNKQNESSRTNVRPTQNTFGKVFDDTRSSVFNVPVNTALEPVQPYDRPVTSRPNSNERKPASHSWSSGKTLETPSVDRLSGKRPETIRRITESSYSDNLNNNDKIPVSNARGTSYNEKKPTNDAWPASPYSGQESYNSQNSRDRQQDQTVWTTQNPFNTPNVRQHNGRPTNSWTTRNPFVSGIVRPVGNENRPPITNKPPKYNQRPQTPVTRQPVYEGISFPDDDDETPDLVVGPDEDYMSEAERRRYIEMAERMCDEYKNLDTKRFAAIPLVPSPEPVSVSVSKCVPTNVPLIVGGKVVSIEEFPHMALLGWKNVQWLLSTLKPSLCNLGELAKCETLNSKQKKSREAMLQHARVCVSMDGREIRKLGAKAVEWYYPCCARFRQCTAQGGGYSWKCGGTLVSDQYVMTAAHCSYQERDNSVLTGPPRVVQLGSSYLDDPGAIVVRVSAAVRHPKYKLPSSYYDLAVLRLITRVSFSQRIKPACLGVPPSPGNPIIATGWGRTEFGGDQSKELRSVSLPIWRIDECRKALGISRKLPNGPSIDSQICAGNVTGGRDTCQGDSGGPVQVQEGCAWRVVAVTSLGRACGAAWTPALYAVVQRAFVAAVAFGGR